MKLHEIHNAVLVWGAIGKESISELKDEQALVIVVEKRPECVGIRHNLPLLQKEGIPAVYCTDTMIGTLLYAQKIKKTYIYTDRDQDDGRENTYVFLLSRLHGVPVENRRPGVVAAADPDRDAGSLGGSNFIVDERSKKYIIGSEAVGS